MMDPKQRTILNGLVRDGHITSWWIVDDGEWRVTLDEDDENAPEVGLPADDYTEWLNH